MKKKTIDKFTIDELGCSEINSKVNLDKMYIPQKSKSTEYIDGNPSEIAEKLVDIFKNEMKVLG